MAGRPHASQMQRLGAIVDDRCVEIEERIAVPRHQIGQPTREEIAGAHLLIQQVQADQMHRSIMGLGETLRDQRPERRQRQQTDQRQVEPGGLAHLAQSLAYSHSCSARV